MKTEGYQYLTGIAALAGGGYVITWEGDGQGISNEECYARIFRADGTAVTGDILVNTTTKGDQVEPDVTGLPDGTFVITWDADIQNAGAYGIFMQRFSADGVRIGGEIRVNNITAAEGPNTTVTSLSDGGFVVAWRNLDNSGHFEIFLQRYDAESQPIGDQFVVSTPKTSVQDVPDVAALADGGFVVSWDAYIIGSTGQVNAVYQRIFSSASGLDGAQYLYGTINDDDLNGGAGGDTMYGGAGNDTYHVDSASDVVSERTDEGNDTVAAAISYTLGINVENLVLSAGNINGTGNELANRITGSVGNNLIDGKAGADIMIGYAGDDTYVVDNAGDEVVELIGRGIDTVQSSVTYTLASNVENLVLTGSGNINGTGNDGVNNTLTGNNGNNVLDGAGGADTMTGGLGNDTYYVGNRFDQINEAAGGGTDTVYSSVSFSLGSQEIEFLTLTGSGDIAGTGSPTSNVITGNSGNNHLDGGAGADTLTGGLGADTFTFWKSSGVDTITDFSAAQRDSIRISAYTHGRANASMITQVGLDVHIDLGGGNMVTVLGATVADVSAHIVW